MSPTRSLPLREVPRFDLEADVVVVGQGAAGGAAAIEAARAGAEVLVLERMTRGGGATALSTGLTYFGGGTAIQRACGFEDSVADMIAYVTLAAGPHVEPERVRLYCEGSVLHFEWFRALGVEFKASFVDDKLTHPVTDDGLMFSGNEQSWPECEQARPFPRGHKPAREGEAGGYLMEAILRGTLAAGAKIVNECRAERLVQRDDGRVVGVAAVREGSPLRVKARRGVVLATGGFIFNKPCWRGTPPPAAVQPPDQPRDDAPGSGWVGAGGARSNWARGWSSTPTTRPPRTYEGRDGRRARPALRERGRLHRPHQRRDPPARGRAALVIVDELYGRTQAMHKLAAVEETFPALEGARDAGVPGGTLETTTCMPSAARIRCSTRRRSGCARSRRRPTPRSIAARSARCSASSRSADSPSRSRARC
jgi:hypothetical protein